MYNHSMQEGVLSFHCADHDCTWSPYPQVIDSPVVTEVSQILLSFLKFFFSKPPPHQVSVDFVPITFYHIIMVHLSF